MKQYNFSALLVLIGKLGTISILIITLLSISVFAVSDQISYKGSGDFSILSRLNGEDIKVRDEVEVSGSNYQGEHRAGLESSSGIVEDQVEVSEGSANLNQHIADTHTYNTYTDYDSRIEAGNAHTYLYFKPLVAYFYAFLTGYDFTYSSFNQIQERNGAVKYVTNGGVSSQSNNVNNITFKSNYLINDPTYQKNEFNVHSDNTKAWLYLEDKSSIYMKAGAEGKFIKNYYELNSTNHTRFNVIGEFDGDLHFYDYAELG